MRQRFSWIEGIATPIHVAFGADWRVPACAAVVSIASGLLARLLIGAGLALRER
jgi:hypothetical protein